MIKALCIAFAFSLFASSNLMLDENSLECGPRCLSLAPDNSIDNESRHYRPGRYRSGSHQPLSDAATEPQRQFGPIYFGLWLIFVGLAGGYVATRRPDKARWVFASVAGTLFIMIGSMAMLSALGYG
jgi:hypothetical protein